MIAAAVSASVLAFATATPVQLENARPGSAGWQVADAGGAVEAYASEVSTTPGGLIHLHVSTNPAASYRLAVYRLGWYGGVGARRVFCGTPCRKQRRGSPMPAPLADPTTGRIAAGWPVTDVIRAGSAWTSGYDLVNIIATTGSAAGSGDSVVVVVKSPASVAASKILVVSPVNTWQAYNSWGARAATRTTASDRRP